MRREVSAELSTSLAGRQDHLQVLSGPSETSLDLINDEKDAIVIADLAKTLEVSLGSGDVSSLAENGLDDESGGVAGGGLLLEEEVELCRRLMRVSGEVERERKGENEPGRGLA